jgi:hypothetical protein
MDKTHVILSSYVKGNELQVERNEFLEGHVSIKVHADIRGGFIHSRGLSLFPFLPFTIHQFSINSPCFPPSFDLCILHAHLEK